MKKYTNIKDFLADLSSEKRKQVETLRQLIHETEPTLEEHIKWNAPSYVFEGEDRITFNVMNKQGLVKLVLHMGATRQEDKKGKPIMKDESGLIEWNSDIRGMITFTDIEDVKSKITPVKKILKNWLSLPEQI